MDYVTFKFNPLGLSHELLCEAYERMLDSERIEDYHAAVRNALEVLHILQLAIGCLVGVEGVHQLMGQWRSIGLARAVPQHIADQFEPDSLGQVDTLLADVLRPLAESDDIVTQDMVIKHLIAVLSVLTRAVLQDHGLGGMHIVAAKLRLLAGAVEVHPHYKPLLESLASATVEGVEHLMHHGYAATMRKRF